MNDDGSSPTPAHGSPVLNVAIEPPRSALDLTSEIAEKDLRLLDAYNHELALDASNDPRPNTDEEEAADQELLARAQRRMSMSHEEVAGERARKDKAP